jgi:DHA3 family macrolide efflux protein-like MFS transporter
MFGPYIRILKNRNFFFLWLGQVISQFGDRLTQIALVGLVYQRFGISSMGLAKTMFFTMLPVFLINPVAGVYIDRWGSRKTMIVADLLRGILVLVMALFLIHLPTFVPVYILIFLVFCVGRFFVPAKMALIPSLVSKEDIVMANSLVSITAMIAAVIGFGVGGLIVEWWGPRGGFTTDAITFFLSAICLSMTAVANGGRFKARDLVELGRDEARNARTLIGELKEGVKALRMNDSTMLSFKSMAVLFSFLGALYVVFIVFIQKHLGSATRDVGILAVWLSAGLALGSLIYGRLSERFSLSRTINVMLGAASVFLIFFALLIKSVPSTGLASIVSVILGMLIAPIVIACNSLIHRDGDESALGRIFSHLEVVMHSGFVVFMFVTSFLAELFSPFVIIVIVGIIGFVFSAYSFACEYRDTSVADNDRDLQDVVG